MAAGGELVEPSALLPRLDGSTLLTHLRRVAWHQFDKLTASRPFISQRSRYTFLFLALVALESDRRSMLAMVRKGLTMRRAFTLVELLVVIGIIAVLIGILLPVLARARESGKAIQCMSNIRNLLQASLIYTNENQGWIIQAGMAHGGAHAHAEVAWFNTLQGYYQNKLVARCPSDDSPHWPGGIPVPPSPDQYRQTSYGLNEFLDRELVPWGGPYCKITQIKHPSTTIQFLEMAENGEYAGADHPHIDLWIGNVLAKASSMVEIHQHGGKTRSNDAMANYGFVDGHVETLRFSDVFVNRQINKFDPAVAP